MTREQAMDLLYSALNEPVGLRVQTGNPHKCINDLHQWKYRFEDESLSALSMVPDPDNPLEAVWIFKKELRSARSKDAEAHT